MRNAGKARLLRRRETDCGTRGAPVSSRGNGDLCDPSFTVATLERVLEYHNAALTALAALDCSPILAADRVAHYRAKLFKIREDIVALIARLRAGG